MGPVYAGAATSPRRHSALTKLRFRHTLGAMNVEVRATGLRAMRDRHKLTQRELARRLGVTQNYIPALEAGTRNPGPKLRQSLMQLFQCDFEDLFVVVMVNPVTKREQVLRPERSSEAS
jgi:DNA-binding XRE family transcriptional regulator